MLVSLDKQGFETPRLPSAIHVEVLLLPVMMVYVMEKKRDSGSDDQALTQSIVFASGRAVGIGAISLAACLV